MDKLNPSTAAIEELIALFSKGRENEVPLYASIHDIKHPFVEVHSRAHLEFVHVQKRRLKSERMEQDAGLLSIKSRSAIFSPLNTLLPKPVNAS